MRAGRCWIRGGWTVTISMASRAPPFQWGAIPLPAVRRAMHYDAQTKSTASLVRRPSKFAGLSRFMLGGWSGWVWPAGQAGSGQLARLGLASGQPPAASLALTRATSESSGLVHEYRVPSIVGVKVTTILQVDPANTLPQVLVCEKSPVATTLEIVTAPVVPRSEEHTSELQSLR